MVKFVRFTKILAINILILSVIALFFELVLQLVAAFRPSYSVLFLEPDSRVGWKMVPNYNWTWAGNHWYANAFSVDVKSNSLGFRGGEIHEKKPVGAIRVAMLGDSFVEAIQVPLDRTSSKLIQSIMGGLDGENTWEVLNFGVSNYGVGQYLLLWENYVKDYSPDYVVFIISDLQMGRSLSEYRAGSFGSTKGKLLSIRPVYRLDEDGSKQLYPQKDYEQFVSLQKQLIDSSFAGNRSKRKDNGLISPGYFNSIRLRIESKLSGQKTKSQPLSISKISREEILRVNYLIMKDLALQVTSSGAKLIMLDASRHFGDPISTTNFLEKASEDLGIHYVPVYKKLIGSDALGRPTTFHTDGHYNEIGNMIIAEQAAGKIKELLNAN